MRLTQIAYEATREPLPPLGTIAELLAKENRRQYYGFIWEPANRETFGRTDIEFEALEMARRKPKQQHQSHLPK